MWCTTLLDQSRLPLRGRHGPAASRLRIWRTVIRPPISQRESIRTTSAPASPPPRAPGPLDLQVPRHPVRIGHVAVAVGGLAGDPVAGTGLLELAAAEPLAQDGPLVLGDRALDLEQELVVRVVGDRPLDELDGARGLAELLQEEDLVGVAAGQPVGGVDAEDVELALAGGVAEAVERGAVEPRARI